MTLTHYSGQNDGKHLVKKGVWSVIGVIYQMMYIWPFDTDIK